MLRIFLACLSLFALSACSPTKDSVGAATATSPAPLSRVPPFELTSCSKDADCVLLEMGCCDYCNGGIVWAVSDAQRSAAETMRPDCNDPPVCTTMGCAEVSVRCQAGHCLAAGPGMVTHGR